MFVINSVVLINDLLSKETWLINSDFVKEEFSTMFSVTISELFS